MHIFILVCLLIVVIIQLKNIFEPSLVFFALLTFYFLLGLIKIDDFLVCFVNKSVFTLVLLLIIADVIARTQLKRYINVAVGTKKGNIFSSGIIAALISSIINNTFVVQMFINILDRKSYKSKVLLPLNYLIILGGTTTLIGTSTNLIANGFLQDRGLKPFNFLDFAYVGIPLVLSGLLYLTFFAPKVLRDKADEEFEEPSNYFLEARVLAGSALHGKTIVQNKLRSLENLFLAEILRNNQLISPVKPDEIILENDVLIFTGDITNVKDLQRFDGIEIFEQKYDILDRNLVSAVISHNSELVSCKIKECNFRKKFDAAIVAIKREGGQLKGKIGEISLKVGDELVLAVGDAFSSTREIKTNFYLLSDINTVVQFGAKKSIFIYLSFLTVVILSALNIIPLIKGLLVLLFMYMVLGFIRFKSVVKNVNINLIILLGSALGISKVLVSNGTADLLSGFIVMLGKSVGVYGTFIIAYLFTILLTELTNHASAIAISFPVAYIAATSLGVNPIPFIFAVTYGSSSSFITQYSYQCNFLVSAAGKYKSKDFLKLGLPLSIIYAIVVLTLVPLFFKF